MRRTTKKLLALGAAASLGLAACGDDDVTPAQSGEAAPVAEETTTTAAGEAADAGGGGEAEVEPTTDDAASQLRAELTSLFQEHVHLLALFGEAAIDAGGEQDDATDAALAAVEENTAAITEALAAVPSVEDPDAFEEAWAEHVELLAQYAMAVAAEDGAAADEAAGGFEGFQQSVADLFEEITDGEVIADEFFGELEMHVTEVMALYDSMAAEDGEAPTLLTAATSHMDAMAANVASAIVASHEEDFAGDPASVPAETRAELTSSLVEHVYLVGSVVEQLAEADGERADPAVQAAYSAVDGSAVALANAVAATGGNERRQVFLDLWRQHTDAIIEYATAKARDDQAAADQARTTLDGFAPAAGAFFEEMTAGATTAGALQADLEMHLSTITAAVDAFAAGDPGAYAQLRAAAQHMPTLAATLARAIVTASDAEDPPAAEGEGEGDAGTTGDTGTTGGATGTGDTGTGTGDAGTETDAGTTDSGTTDSGTASP